MSNRLRSALLALTTTLAFVGCSDAPAAPVDASPELSIARRGPAIYVSSLTKRDTLTKDETLQLIAVGIDTRGRLLTNSNVTWSTSDSTRAVVSRSGRVTAMSASGPVTIFAKAGSITGNKAFIIKGLDVVEPPAVVVPPVVPELPPVVVPPVVVPPVVPPAVVPPVVVPPTPDVSQAWTYCADAGWQTCFFNGRRDVRMIAASGASIVTTGFSSLVCATSSFSNQTPSGSGAMRCEYGRMQTTSLPNPFPGYGLSSTVTVPLGSDGSGARLSRADPYNTPRAVDDGMGAFRTTCETASFQFNDPIVYPGRANAAHLHIFLGNTAIDANSTNASLASSGNSTCRGGTLNRSSYWAPAVYDSRTGEVQVPSTVSVYYKTGYNFDVTQTRVPPAGLRMIAGDKNATGPQQSSYWACTNVFVSPDGMIPNCGAGDELQLNISFAQCWDGVNLDSPDHKSHMAYPIYRNPPQRSTCPSTHPVLLPSISVLFHYPVKAGTSTSTWRLTSDVYSTSIRGGLSAHSDWMNGWDQPTLTKIVTLCLNRGLDCGIGNLGDGTTLY